MIQAYQILEERFGDFIGNKNVVVCSSGTAALHLAFEVMRVSKGLEERSAVAVPDTCMIAGARAVKMAGFQPDFASVDFLGLLTQEAVKEHHSAVLVVHLYGRKANTNYSVPVVEDLAEAHGIKPNPDSFAACWSFYKNKVIGGEEGGAVAFKNQEDAELARELRSLGMTDRHDFIHTARGMNYRLSNANAEPILRSLRAYDLNLVRRRRIETMYDQNFPQEWKLPKRDIPWVYDLDLPKGVDNYAIVQGLNKVGMQARVAFKPMSVQPEFKQEETCPTAIEISQRRMYLLIDPSFKQYQVDQICKKLLDLVDGTE